MPKLLPKRRFSSSVVEARAGMVPASDWIDYELELSLAQIGRAVAAYAKRSGGRADLGVTSMLQHLRHYCDSKGLGFGMLDEAASEYYRKDVNESPWISRRNGS